MNIKVIYGKILVTMSRVFGVDFAKDEEGNLFICFLAFREEKEIMYGKPFVGFSEILSTKKQRDFQVSY